MKDGDPAEVLAAQADELDLLVLGSRGYGPSAAPCSEACPRR
jgi:nucleotide-binding universal stress UspA family protein